MKENEVNNFYDMCLNGGSFNGEQLEQIQLGLYSLSLGDVKFYASKDFDWGQMYEIRKGLETLPLVDVLRYAKPEMARITMSSYRMSLENKLFMKLFDIDPTFLVPSQIRESLKIIKRLPLDKALEIIDFRDSASEMKAKCEVAETRYFNQRIIQCVSDDFTGNQDNLCEVICGMIDNLSSEELEEVINHINSKECGKSLVKKI